MFGCRPFRLPRTRSFSSKHNPNKLSKTTPRVRPSMDSHRVVPQSLPTSKVTRQTSLLPKFDWHDNVVPGTKLTYLRQAVAVDEALEAATGPFGFDLEWKPTFVKGRPASPIAVVQLARSDQIYIVQISEMSEFPAQLQKILENPCIVKAGVGIASDAKKLWQDCGVSLLGAVELSDLARASDASRWTKERPQNLISLARLIEAYYNQCLAKGKVRMSNWERLLTETQLDYAASDALAGYAVYQHLLALDPLDPSEAYTYNFLAGKRTVAKKKTRSPNSVISSGTITIAGTTSRQASN